MVIEQKELQEMIPHAFPFLMLDRVTEIEPGKSGTGIKNITINDSFSEGKSNFLPATLLIEACSQLTAVVCSGNTDTPRAQSRPSYLAGIPTFKFLKPVSVGDRLTLKATIIKRVQHLLYVNVQALVESTLVAKGSIMVAGQQ